MQMLNEQQQRGTSVKNEKTRKKGVHIRISYDFIYYAFIIGAISLVISGTGFPFLMAALFVTFYLFAPIAVAAFTANFGNGKLIFVVVTLYLIGISALTFGVVKLAVAYFS